MKWFKNLKIRVKLLLGFILVSVLTLFVGILGLTNMGDLNYMLDSIYKNDTIGISFVKEANVDLVSHGRALNNFLLSSSSKDRNTYRNRLNEYEALLKQNLEKAKPLMQTDEEKQLIAKFEREWKNYKKIVKQIIEKAGLEDLMVNKESVQLAMTVGREEANLIDTLLVKLSRLQEDNGKQYYDESRVLYANSRKFMIFLLIGAVCLGLLIGFYLANYLSKKIKQVAERMQSLSSRKRERTIGKRRFEYKYCNRYKTS